MSKTVHGASDAVKRFIKRCKGRRGYREGDIVRLADSNTLHVIYEADAAIGLVELVNIQASYLKVSLSLDIRLMDKAVADHYKLESITIEDKQYKQL